MTDALFSEDKRDFLKEMGADLRVLREQVGATQQEIASFFDWQRNAVSQIELGHTNIGLYEYLNIVWFLKDAAGGHVGLPLAKMLVHDRKAKRRTKNKAGKG